MAGTTLDGRRPVDDTAGDPIDTEEVVRAPLVCEVPKTGTIGGTRPVLEVVVVVAETGLPVELDPEIISGTVEAVPTNVGAALVSPMILVDRSVEPRLFVAVRTTDDSAEGDDVTLAIGVTVEPKESIESGTLESEVVVPATTLLTDVPEPGSDDAMTTGDDSVTAVRLVPGDAIDVTELGIEVARIEDSTEV